MLQYNTIKYNIWFIEKNVDPLEYCVLHIQITFFRLIRFLSGMSQWRITNNLWWKWKNMNEWYSILCVYNSSLLYLTKKKRFMTSYYVFLHIITIISYFLWNWNLNYTHAYKFRFIIRHDFDGDCRIKDLIYSTRFGCH